MSKATHDVLEALHGHIAEDLIRRIQSGEATASDLNVARQFLKDNGIEQLPTRDNETGRLVQNLPFDASEDDATVVPFASSSSSSSSSE